MYLYSPRPFQDYRRRLPTEHELGALASLRVIDATAVWNAYWLFQPAADLILSGEPWHTAMPLIPGLLPAIIIDMLQYGMSPRFTDHPLLLADWFLFSQARLKMLAPVFRGVDLHARCISVADRLLDDDPLIVAMGDTFVLRYP